MITLCILLFAAFQVFVLVFTAAIYIVGGVIAVLASGLGVYDPTKTTNSRKPRKKSALQTLSEPPYTYGAVQTYEDMIEDEDFKHYLIAQTLLDQ